MVNLSVVVVTWNAGEALVRCLDSIPAAAGDIPYETILVDNASTDQSVEHARRMHPSTCVVSPGENLGFGRGVELATQHAQGEILAIVNPDLVLKPRGLEELVQFLESHPETGLVGPKVCSLDGTIETGAERFPGLLSAFAEVPLAARLYRRARERWRNVDETVSCDWVRGALMVLRTKALRRAGGFPTATFMYGEEMLLGRALREAGWKVFYVPKTLGVHETGFSSRQRWTLEERIIVQRISRIRTMRDFLSAPSFTLWNLIIMIGLVAQDLAAVLPGRSWSRRYLPCRQLLRLHGRALVNPGVEFHIPEGRTL